MSLALDLTEENYIQYLLNVFPKYERYVSEAEKLFDLEGQFLEKIARSVPQHQAAYAERSIDMKGVVKWLENHKAKLEAIHLKNYMRGQRALSVSDQRILMAGESNIVELNQFIIEGTILQNKLEEITEGFRQMGWMVGSIVKLRVAELGEIVL